MSTTTASDNATSSDTDYDIRIAVFCCSCVIAFLVAFRRCTRKVPSAAVNNVLSRGDIVPVPQEQVIRVDHRDLGRLKIAEYYRPQFPGGTVFSSSTANVVDEDGGVPLR